MNRDSNTCKAESSSISVDLEGLGLSESQKVKLAFLLEFGKVFSDYPGLSHMAWHEIKTFSAAPLARKLHRDEKV